MGGQFLLHHVRKGLETALFKPFGDTGCHRIRAYPPLQLAADSPHRKRRGRNDREIGVDPLRQRTSHGDSVGDADAGQQFFVLPLGQKGLDLLFKRGIQTHLMPIVRAHDSHRNAHAARA